MSGKITKEDAKRIEETQKNKGHETGPNTFTERVKDAADRNANANAGSNAPPAGK
ncbi:hypothetical protein FRB94_008239 [Tulasnella sp. JGI-2019a]|nr:hypothetical protein FRB93_002130 [Tulasnella sp. JGI-2019a]KAG8996513.1 hypothetical protein FRB94_008239 [Tulasnella sp. JGI-2019a]